MCGASCGLSQRRPTASHKGRTAAVTGAVRLYCGQKRTLSGTKAVMTDQIMYDRHGQKHAQDRAEDTRHLWALHSVSNALRCGAATVAPCADESIGAIQSYSNCEQTVDHRTQWPIVLLRCSESRCEYTLSHVSHGLHGARLPVCRRMCAECHHYCLSRSVGRSAHREDRTRNPSVRPQLRSVGCLFSHVGGGPKAMS
jgi:hypothetical protein